MGRVGSNDTTPLPNALDCEAWSAHAQRQAGALTSTPEGGPEQFNALLYAARVNSLFCPEHVHQHGAISKLGSANALFDKGLSSGHVLPPVNFLLLYHRTPPETVCRGPEPVDPLRHISRAPPPIKPIRHVVAVRSHPQTAASIGTTIPEPPQPFEPTASVNRIGEAIRSAFSSTLLRRPLDAKRIAIVRRRMTTDQNAFIDKLHAESGVPVIDFWNFLRIRAGDKISASPREDPMTAAWRLIERALTAIGAEEQAAEIAEAEMWLCTADNQNLPKQAHARQPHATNEESTDDKPAPVPELESEPEASAALPKPAIADLATTMAESSNAGAAPPTAPVEAAVEESPGTAVEVAPAATPPAPATNHLGVTPPGVDSKEQALEAWVRDWPKRVQKGPKRETYNDWAHRRLAAAKDASELQGVHITQNELRKVDRKIGQKPS